MASVEVEQVVALLKVVRCGRCVFRRVLEADEYNWNPQTGVLHVAHAASYYQKPCGAHARGMLRIPAKSILEAAGLS